MTSYPTTGRPLDDQLLQVFAAQLEEQRRFRLDQVRELSADRGATGTAATAEITTTLLAGARAALAEIEAARMRLSVGSYGRCVDCGTRLPVERLEVLPSVARCQSCHRASSSGALPVG